MAAQIYRPRRTRTSLLTVALALLLACALSFPAVASAGQFKRDAAGDVKARGVKGAQRKALDIIGIDLTKTAFVAKVVVRFKGNFERAMLTRGLANAGVLIRLSSPGGSTTVATTGAGRRYRTIGAPGGPFATVRSGREVTFWVANLDAYRLSKVEARTFRKRARRAARGADAVSELRQILKNAAADGASLSTGGAAPQPGVDCKRIRDLLNVVRERIIDLPTGGGRGKAPPSLFGKSKEREQLEKLEAEGLRYLQARCGSGGGVGGSDPGQPGNQPPQNSFIVDDPKPAAGQIVNFQGSQNDPDGQVTSWRWDFGDGTSQTGAGNTLAPSASHTYANAGRYVVTLTTYDDRGGSTTSEAVILVSGPGSKQGSASGLDCSSGVTGIYFDVYIPSWADPPYNFTINDPICPGRTQSASGEIRPDLSPPPGEPKDEHGNTKKVFRITVTLGAGSGTTGSASYSVSWN